MGLKLHPVFSRFGRLPFASLALFIAVLLSGTFASPAATITWSGAGGDFLWSNPLNWTGGVLPVSQDDVVINVPGLVTVRMDVPSASIRSLQCQESLVIEASPFTLTAGASVINGALRMGYGQTLKVNGVTAMLTVNGAVTNVAGLEALNGGVMAFPSVRQLTVDDSTALGTYQYSGLYAQGPGSSILMTNLTNLVIAPYYYFRVDATGGGRIDLRRLRMPEGPISVATDNTNSLVDLSALSGMWMLAPDYSYTWHVNSLSAGDGSTILIPNVTGCSNVNWTLSGSASVHTAQLRSFTGGSLSLTSRTNGFAGLTNFGGSISASDARLDLTNITSIYATYPYPGIYASQGSVIDLSSVTNVVNDSGSYFGVSAYSGGRINLRRLRVPQGRFAVSADQVGSLVDLSGFTGEWTSQSNSYNSLVQASSGGSVSISNLTAMRNINLSLNDDAVVPTAQLRSFTEGSIILYRCTNNFAGLTNMDGSTVTADDRGAVLIPNVTAMHRVTLNLMRDAIVPTAQVRSFTDGYITLVSRTNGFAGLTNFSGYLFASDTRLDLTNFTVLYLTNKEVYFQADQNSFIDLSRLTNVVSNPASYALYAYASGGSRIDLRRLRIPDGAVSVSVVDAGSLVDLSGFSGLWHGVGCYLNAGNGGTLLMPNVTALNGLTLDVSGSAIVNLAQLTSITAGSLTLRSRTNDLPGLTNFTGSITATDSKLYLTNLTTLYVTNNMSIRADTDALIDLSRITNVVRNGYTLFLYAYSGGHIDMSGLRVPDVGPLQVDAQQVGSLVDFSGFSGLWDAQDYIGVKVSSGAAVAISNVSAMRNISLTLAGDASVPVAQLHSIIGGSVTLQSHTNVFTGLTNFASYLGCDTDGLAEFPNLIQLNTADSTVTFSASYGGVIDISHVTNAVVETYGLSLAANYGGRIAIPNLESIVAGSVSVQAVGADAVVDLRSLTGFFSDNNGGSLGTSGGGVILLNTNAMLLAGVAIDLQSNPGGVIPSFLAAAQSVVLYGRPWESYRVEWRDPSVSGSPWSLYSRVALTTPFETLGARPPANALLRVSLLVADPPEVGIGHPSPGQVNLILFGKPGRTYRLESRTNAASGVWENGPVKAMTNSFFIFPATGATNAARFYRAREL